MNNNNSNNNFDGDAISQFEMPTLFTLSAIEMLLNLVEVPASVLNVYLIGRTPLIHLNLKFILLYQSAWICIRGIARFVICLIKFFTANALDSEQLQPLKFFYLLSAYNRNFVPHILIIERLYATFWRRKYEASSGWHFSIGWSNFVFFISLYNALSTSSTNKSIFGLATTLALLLLGAVELLIFIWLCHYNVKVYKGSLANKKLHNLTERYQLSQNIRIGTQLMPTVVLQLLNVSVTSVYLCSTNFAICPRPNICSMAVVTVTTFFGLLIEITMITHHPFLSRNFHQILRQFSSKVGSIRRPPTQVHCANDQTTMPKENGGGEAIAMRHIINGQLLTKEKGDHFAMLEKTWEIEARRHQKL